jgi:dolichol-phosphate mannosyltransferase
MSSPKKPLISVVVPLYNEAAGLVVFNQELTKVLKAAAGDYEVIYVDDGSDDNPAASLKAERSDKIKLIKFSRNFGKENALTAGIAAASGQAIIMIDGDGQHPVNLIPEMIAKWRAGAQVVIGVRAGKGQGGWSKRASSSLFYKLFNRLTGQKLIPGSTDFRLIDRVVQRAFLELKESDRITRGLIDWLGFRRELVPFEAQARQQGAASYGRGQLFRLASNSFVSLSPKPLYIFGYLGVVITILSFVLGSAVLIEQLILSDPLNWNFTGTAMLGILILFLVGILLLSQGILSLYISHIHSLSKQRPLYVIDYDGSVGLKDPRD